VSSATAEPIVRQSLVINYKMLLVHVGTILRQRVPGNDNVIRSAHVKKGAGVLFHAHIRPIGTHFAQTRGRRFHSQGI